MKKQLTAFFLSLVLCLGLCTPAFAATTGEQDNSGNVTIKGDGFQPGEDVFIVIKDKNDTVVNIGTGKAEEDGTVSWNGSSDGKNDLTFDIEGTITEKESGKVEEKEETPITPTPPGSDDNNKPDDRPSIPSYPDYVIGGGSEGTKKPSVKTYAISVPSNVAHGTVSVLWPSAAWGDTVTITATPEAGYELDTLTVTDKDGNELTVTDRGNNKYTFVMPEGEVSIQASFKVSEKKQPTITSKEESCQTQEQIEQSRTHS